MKDSFNSIKDYLPTLFLEGLKKIETFNSIKDYLNWGLPLNSKAYKAFNSIKDYLTKRRSNRATASRYFQFHQGLSLRSKQMIHNQLKSFNSIKDYLITGMTGSGKTTTAFQFHQGLSAEAVQYIYVLIDSLSIPSRIIDMYYIFHYNTYVKLLSIPSRIIKPHVLFAYMVDQIVFQFHQGLSKMKIQIKKVEEGKSFNSIKDYLNDILQFIQQGDVNFQFHQGLSNLLRMANASNCSNLSIPSRII